jgi:ubiquinone/menaquinone biosynthesis C-methylase UbiE
VAGIPVLKKGNIGSAGQSSEEVIALIENGRQSQALFSLVTPPGLPPSPSWIRSLPSMTGINRFKNFAWQRSVRQWQEQAAALLGDEEATACDLLDLYFSRNKNKIVRDYFAFRFGNGRYLVGLSFAASLAHQPDRALLDLACGCGHLTRGLVQQASDRPVIGVDDSFFGLYVAKRWTAPQAEYVCCAADSSLPFPDGTFSAAFCSDAFHYFVDKPTSTQELKRLTRDHGTIVLLWVRNGLLEHPYKGLALPPAGYQALVDDMPNRLVADSEVLARYLQNQGPALARPEKPESLAQEPVLSIVASHRQEALVDYGTFEDWPHARGRLDLNPLYVKEPRNGDGSVSLRRRFPSPLYEQLNEECKSYLPASVDVNETMWTDLANGNQTEKIEALVRQCVLLAIPERYGSPNDW